MKKVMLLLFATLLLVACGPKGQMKGKILSQWSNNPIENVTIKISNETQSFEIQTNSNGEISIQNLPLATYEVSISKENYDSKTIENVTITKENIKTPYQLQTKLFRSNLSEEESLQQILKALEELANNRKTEINNTTQENLQFMKKELENIKPSPTLNYTNEDVQKMLKALSKIEQKNKENKDLLAMKKILDGFQLQSSKNEEIATKKKDTSAVSGRPNIIGDLGVRADALIASSTIGGAHLMADGAGIMANSSGKGIVANHRSVSLSRDSFNHNYNSEEYSEITENGFQSVTDNPQSTFSIDVDAASYSNARRFIMDNQLPRKDAIRVEEFINYFTYDYEQPKDEHPLAVNMEYGDCPWNKENKLVHIGIQGEKLKQEDDINSNLVFLLDVSGSMNSHDKLPLLKKAFGLLVDNLSNKDRVSIVVYAGSSGVVLPATKGSNKQKIKEALNKLNAGGSTAGGAGIKLAYKLAKENFIEGGNNRVILATDGDFNVGVSSKKGLEDLIVEKRKDGIFLTVLGFGTGNYKDSQMETLADKGNGNYAYIDNILEAKKVLVNEINSTLFTIAKDVKIQVQFNPAKVSSYRLIGYENRLMAAEDFRNDKKDAGEVGAGHTVTALYEVVLKDSKNKNQEELKYFETKIKDEAKHSDEVMTVYIRYKKPDGEKATEFTKSLSQKPKPYATLSNNFRFSAAVAEFGMLLRNSEHKADSKYAQVLKLAKKAKGDDEFGYRAEFIRLVERAELLKET